MQQIMIPSGTDWQQRGYCALLAQDTDSAFQEGTCLIELVARQLTGRATRASRFQLGEMVALS